jgi:cold-inducible RNA-binding protein
MTKLFVGSLPFSTTSDQLGQMFSQYGSVASATVIMDKFTGRSRGFGFVEMENDAEAQEAIKSLNGSQIEGRSIVVSVAKPKEDRPSHDDFRRDDHRGGGGFRDNRNRR